jgi:hypothetical protein
MFRVGCLIAMSCGALHANQIMWKATGTVTSGNSSFGVSSGKKVELMIRYAPEDRVSVTEIPQNSQYVKRKVYHGAIKLRIELKIDGKQWIVYLPQVAFNSTTDALNPLDVRTVSPSINFAGGADWVRFHVNNLNNAQFEAFHYNQQTTTRGVYMDALDDVALYEMLALGAFPGTNLVPSKMTKFTGFVYAGTFDNRFSFSLDPKTVRLSIYVPPLPPITIHRGPNNSMQIKFISEEGVWYQLETSQNMSTWSAAATIFGVGQEQTHSVPAFLPSSFYRLRLAPP